MPYVSRVIGVEGVGIFSKVSSLVIFLSVFIIFGLGQLGSREIARSDLKDRSRRFSELYSLQVVFGFLVTILFILFSIFFIKDNSLQKYYLLQLPLLVSYIFDISWFFIGIGEMTKVVVRNTTIKVLVVLLIFVLVHSKDDLWIYMMLNGISTLFANFVLWKSLYKEIGKFELIITSKYLKDGFILLLPQIAVAIIVQLAVTFVGSIGGTVAASYYDQSQKLIRVVLALLSSANIVLMPMMSKLDLKGSVNKINEIIFITIRIQLLLSFWFIVILYTNADVFIPWFFGTSFTPMVMNFKIAILLIMFNPIKALLDNQLLLARGLFKNYCLIMVTMAFINIFFICTFTHFYGSVGASVGMVLTEGIGLLIQLFVVRKYIEVRKLLSISLSTLVALLVSIFLLSLFQYSASPFIAMLFKSIVGTICYVIIIMLISKENRAFFFKAKEIILKNIAYKRRLK